jgi:predicted CoA-binding protein
MTVEQDIMKNCRTVAVVGLSSDEERPSYRVAKYLQAHGYKIIPVNPKETQVLGQLCYPDLKAVPVKVDVVDIFRRSEDVPPIVDQAIEIGAIAVWMQEGIKHEQAAEKARLAGLKVVQNHCMLKEHRLINW